MSELTAHQLEAGMAALHQARMYNRADDFAVRAVWEAIQGAVEVIAPAQVEVQVIGTGGGPDDHANPVTDQEAHG